MFQRSRALAFVVIAATSLAVAGCGWFSSPPPPRPAPMPAPPPPPPPIPGPQTMAERTLLTMATDLAFAPGSFTIRPGGRAKLNALMPALKGLGPTDKIVVYGYTDNKPVGGALKKAGVMDNLDLSSRRADAVVRYLTAKGINPAVISAKGRGETHPIAPNTTTKGRAENRRIEVVVEQPAG